MYQIVRLGGKTMQQSNRMKYLRVALVMVGLTFILGLYPLTLLWPSGWSWQTGQSEYLQMILGIYATLGVFLIIAAKTPLAHRGLIGFTVWSSIVHAGIMAIQSFTNHEHLGHLYGDVPALLMVAAVLKFLMPKSPRSMLASPLETHPSR
jgi:hypothetical protein